MSQGISKLIINADDFGETIQITKGIADCISAGVVTSTTILANMPGTDLAFRLAVGNSRKVSFGVHLNICEGKPLAKPSSMVRPEGSFFPKRYQALRAFTGRLNLKEVEIELRAQIMLVKAAGVDVSHLDSHKHLHQLPGVAEVVAKLAAEFKIRRVRCTLEDGFWSKGNGLFAGLSRSFRRHFAGKFRVHLSANGLRYPGRAFDLTHLMRLSERSEQVNLLRHPQTITEMFCHPATEEADKEKPGSCSRFAEYRFLMSDEFKGLIDEANVKLVSFWDL